MPDETPVTSEGVPAPSQLQFHDEDESEDVLAGGLSATDHVADRAGVVRELLQFLWTRRLWWMAPMVAVLLLFGILMVLAAATPLGPFIYTLF